MVVIKISLKNEIRRFTCEDPQRVDVFALARQHFPEIASKDFVLSYVDDEGDSCTLTATSSADEWREALNFVNSTNVLRLSIRVVAGEGSRDQPAHRAMCDVCNSRIIGVRYKCLVCPDFDLCAACEGADDSHTSAHAFAKLRTPDAQFWRRGPCGGRGFGFRPWGAPQEGAAPQDAAAPAEDASPAGEAGECGKGRGWGCGRRRPGAWWRRQCGAPGGDAPACGPAAAAACAGASPCGGAEAAARAFGIPTEWLGRAQELLASGVPLPEVIAGFLSNPAAAFAASAPPASAPPESAPAATTTPVPPPVKEPAPGTTEDATPRHEKPTEDAAAPSSVRAAPEEPTPTPAAAAAPPAADSVPPFMQFLQNLTASGVNLPELAATFLGGGRPDAAPAPDSPAMTQALETLATMGFVDDGGRHRALLTRYDLNVDRVVAELLPQ